MNVSLVLPGSNRKKVGRTDMMTTEQLYLKHHGLMLPKETHSRESLTFFAQEFSFKDDDTIAVTYPKSGTIWMQEILPLVLSEGDLTPIQTIPNWDRVPWLEEKRLKEVVDQLSSPRALVTHFPFQLMPQSFFSSKAKMAAFLEDPGTWDEFIDKFLEGKVMFGKWTDHVKSWKHADLGDRIMYITYEQMIQDLPSAVRRIADFLGKNLSDEVIEKIANHCSFKSMQANKMSNFSLVPKMYMDADKSQFLRKGIVGDWKKHFSSAQLAHFSSTIYKELEGETFTLPWNLSDAAEVTNVYA
ncbi:sulfotransferase family 2, cytosolic sulfotransferase 3 isoform X2 [Corythoichthys intestinalis]|uniref:sulfotransferase family 2, cytosolic sulfotransferase 3 isoform X2 n=1 Tax=Corythoichthys intestinalis TaxID=161448 RepID=UPI0025A60C7C|nr:sulfotransferase family 2, cytosolic sulfotransferase 3 isoform X2 [Corythoichthys intestinalis]